MLADLICGMLYAAVCQTIEEQTAHRAVARKKHKRFDRTLLLAAQSVRAQIGIFGSLIFR